MKTIQYLLMLILALSAFTCVNKTDKAGNDLQNRELESPDSGMAEIYFDYTEYDFGKIVEGEKVGCIFKYKNTGKDNLIIQKASGSCGCTVPRWDRNPVGPGESGQLEVIFDSSGRRGKQNKSVTVTSNSRNKVTVLTIKAEIIVRES